MRTNLSKKAVKSKADTGVDVFFHCPLVIEKSPLDEWAIEQLSYLSSLGWRLSRFRKAGSYHLLSPMTGEA
jgi:hypothetical protein